MISSVSEAGVAFNKPPSGGETVTFPENTAPGTRLYTVQANSEGNQPVFSVNTKSLCELPFPNNSIADFTLNQLDELLVPGRGLDAETCTQYKFIFNVIAGTSTSTSDPLTIIVTNINDNPPRFNKSSYVGEVWKNQKHDDIVNKDDVISAEDPDQTKLPITFSISGAQTTFAINNNGFVYVNDTSGLAALSSPTVLQIEASDGLTSNAILNIAVNADSCSNKPCQNSATCTSDRSNYTCNCLSGYLGKRCEKIDYCYNIPCQNDGKCTSLTNTYSCNCTCHFGISSPENKNCTIKNDVCKKPSPPKTNVGLIIGLVGTVIAVIAVGSSAAFFRLKNKKKNEKGPESDKELAPLQPPAN